MRTPIWMVIGCAAIMAAPQFAEAKDPASVRPLDVSLVSGNPALPQVGTCETAYNLVMEAFGGKLPEKAETEVKEKSPDVSVICPRFVQEKSGKIRVDEPMRVSNYDLEQLGIVDIAVNPRTRSFCIGAALEDGAEILESAEDHVRLYYPTRLEAFLDDARSRIYVSAVEGRWSDSLDRVIPGVSGRELNVQATTEAFFKAVSENQDHFSIVVDSIPSLSADVSQIGDFRPSVLIGEYKTHFSKAKNRTHNVKLAAAALNGVFLMPGAVFSYNSWVGERSEERGFKEAPVIENGELVEGLGGGACQVSSTIHAAALLSGLEVIERTNHSLPSSYIGKGLDAVVSYPIMDLRVKNSRTRPVVLRVSTDKDNNLIARFFSDEPRQEKIKFKNEVIEEIPFSENISEDPELEEGTFKIKRTGKPGYKIQRSLIITLDGKEKIQRLGIDVYQPTTQIVLLGPNAVYPPPEEE